MSGLDQKPLGVDWHGPHYGMAKFTDTNRLVVLFYTKSVQNNAKSVAAGTPIFENKIYVRIHEPGESLNIVDRPASESDKVRFVVQWQRFLQKQEQVPEGTPIDLLFPNNPAVADMLKSRGVYTIQQCANLSAHAIDSVGIGGQQYVNMANQFLESATDGLAFHALQEKNKKLEQENKILKDQFDKMRERLGALEQKFSNPEAARLSPGWIQGHDAPAERINANHPSVELAKKKRKSRVTKQEETEEINNSEDTGEEEQDSSET